MINIIFSLILGAMFGVLLMCLAFVTKESDRQNYKVRVKLDDGAYAPESAHDADAGYDLRTPKDITIRAGGCGTIDTGVHIEIPKGYVGFLKSKSGLNVKSYLTGEGVIDSGYTGSVVVRLYHNITDGEDKHFKKGDKIIQIVLLPIFKPDIEIVDELEATERGDGGFGSTGR